MLQAGERRLLSAEARLVSSGVHSDTNDDTLDTSQLHGLHFEDRSGDASTSTSSTGLVGSPGDLVLTQQRLVWMPHDFTLQEVSCRLKDIVSYASDASEPSSSLLDEQPLGVRWRVTTIEHKSFVFDFAASASRPAAALDQVRLSADDGTASAAPEQRMRQQFSQRLSMLGIRSEDVASASTSQPSKPRPSALRKATHRDTHAATFDKPQHGDLFQPVSPSAVRSRSPFAAFSRDTPSWTSSANLPTERDSLSSIQSNPTASDVPAQRHLSRHQGTNSVQDVASTSSLSSSSYHGDGLSLAQSPLRSSIRTSSPSLVSLSNISTMSATTAASGDSMQMDADVDMDDMTTKGPHSEPHTSTGIRIGERVVLPGQKAGLLKYCGLVHFDAGEWCGIELDQEQGDCDGSLDKIRYFRCPNHRGVFVPVAQAVPEPIGRSTGWVALRKVLLLNPPSWTSKDAMCAICGSTFSATLRRHHCRNCGAAVCSKCSSHKMPLPYLGYPSFERVCTTCMPVAKLVLCASALDSNGSKIQRHEPKRALQLQHHAASKLLAKIKGLSAADYAFLRDRYVVPAVVHLMMSPAPSVHDSAAACLRYMADDPANHRDIIVSGGLFSLSRLVRLSGSAETRRHCIKALALLVKEASPTVLNACLESKVHSAALLELAESESSLSATKVLCGQLLASLCRNDDAKLVVAKHKHGLGASQLLGEALRLGRIDEEGRTRRINAHAAALSPLSSRRGNSGFFKAQEAILCCLAHMTCHTQAADVIEGANDAMGNVLQLTVTDMLAPLSAEASAPTRIYRSRSLTHAACIAANLVCTPTKANRYPLFSLLTTMLTKAPSDDAIEHVIRGLANLSSHASFSRFLVEHVHDIAQPLVLQSYSHAVRRHTLRALHNLALLLPNELANVLGDFEAALCKLATGKREKVQLLALSVLRAVDLLSSLDDLPDETTMRRIPSDPLGPEQAEPTKFFELLGDEDALDRSAEKFMGKNAALLRGSQHGKARESTNVSVAAKLSRLAKTGQQRQQELEDLICQAEECGLSITAQDLRTDLENMRKREKLLEGAIQDMDGSSENSAVQGLASADEIGTVA